MSEQILYGTPDRVGGSVFERAFLAFFVQVVGPQWHHTAVKVFSVYVPK